MEPSIKAEDSMWLIQGADAMLCDLQDPYFPSASEKGGPWHQKDQRRLVPGDIEMEQKSRGIAIHPQARVPCQTSTWVFD